MKTTMGEKIKDLWVERRMTTKQLAQATGISEAVLNGLENDNGRDVGYSKEVQLDSPEQSAMMLAERMGVSEERMKAIMKLLSDND